MLTWFEVEQLVEFAWSAQWWGLAHRWAPHGGGDERGGRHTPLDHHTDRWRLLGDRNPKSLFFWSESRKAVHRPARDTTHSGQLIQSSIQLESANALKQKLYRIHRANRRHLYTIASHYGANWGCSVWSHDLDFHDRTVVYNIHVVTSKVVNVISNFKLVNEIMSQS